MLLDPAAPLRDHSKPCYRGVDNTQRTRYCGFYARAKEPCPNRAEQHRAAGSEASAIGDGFRERGWIEQAIRWHLQDAWHHHVSFDYARHAAEREAAVVGEVDAWGAVAACCFAEGVRSADERLEWLQRRCAYYHRAMLAAERDGGGAGGLVKLQEVLHDLGMAVLGLREPLEEEEAEEEEAEGGGERATLQHVRTTLELERVRRCAVQLQERALEVAKMLPPGSARVLAEARALRALAESHAQETPAWCHHETLASGRHLEL